MDTNKFPRRPATIFNDFKYPMPRSLKPVEGARFPATWNWEYAAKGNKIFFKVNDGIYGKNDDNAKLKEVELNFAERNSLLFVIEQAISDKEFGSSQVDIYRKLYNNGSGKYNDKPSVMATFTVIRGKSGEIRVHYRRSTYELTFAMSTEFIKCSTRNADGEFVNDPGLASRAYTQSFIDFSRKFLDPEEWAKYKREVKGEDNSDSGSDYRKPKEDSKPGPDQYDFGDDLDF